MNDTMITNAILEDLQWRYACKKYDSSKKIAKEDLNTILHALNLTATSLGFQLLKCVVVENQALKDALVDCAYGQRQVADCSELLVLCRYDDVEDSDIDEYVNRTAHLRNFDPSSSKIQGFKKMIQGAIPEAKERRIHWMENQVYIALGNLLNVCAQLRIDACPMEGFAPEKVDALLDLPSLGLRSVLLCPVGYRHSEDPYASQPKVRKSLSNFVVSIK